MARKELLEKIYPHPSSDFQREELESLSASSPRELLDSLEAGNPKIRGDEPPDLTEEEDMLLV